MKDIFGAFRRNLMLAGWLDGWLAGNESIMECKVVRVQYDMI
jgi:hypothetical protein